MKNKYQNQVIDKETGEKFFVTSYQEMDKSEILDDMFFDGDIMSTKGEEYVNKFKNFPSSIKDIAEELVFREKENKVAKTQLDGTKQKESVEVIYNFESVNSVANERFNYTEKVLKEDGTKQEFLNYNFQGFPVIASIAKLTKIQSDIRFIENSVLNEINNALGGGSLNSFQTLLVSEKPTFYTSETVNASIVMGKKDAAYEPDRVELFINGTQLKKSEYSIEKGAVVLNKRISSAGTYDLTGFIYKNNVDTQEEEKIPVNLKLEITREPNSAVVSADNMKVFYRGLRNPTSISIPGVAANTIVPSSKNAKFSRSKKGWAAQPTNSKAKEMNITVSGMLNGKRKNFNGGTFRILNAPPGKGSVKGMGKVLRTGQSGSKTLISNGLITGEKPKNFFYDYSIDVTGYDIKVGNNTSISVKGNKVSGSRDAARIIKSSSKGTVVQILNIRASMRDGNVVTPNYEVEQFYIIIE